MPFGNRSCIWSYKCFANCKQSFENYEQCYDCKESSVNDISSTSVSVALIARLHDKDDER